jgi:flavin reductase (DIM6/NTAB) family NADH-FMN oxidoreductase RutF
MEKAAINQENFKDSMRMLTGAVNIVTTQGEAGSGGFTATAVCSVTDNPPTLLVCMNKSNELAEAVLKNKKIAVSILPTGTENLANRFAGMDGVSMEERLEKGEWQTLTTGCPILQNALAAFDCIIESTIEQGTHLVIFARIVAVKPTQEQLPLLYFNRDYHTTNN